MNGFHPGQGFAAGTFPIEDTTSTMAVKAAEKALEVAGNQCGRIRSLFSLQHYQEIMQHQITACQVQKGNRSYRNAVCMDINAACSGFVLD